jgi:hypothetical protein
MKSALFGVFFALAAPACTAPSGAVVLASGQSPTSLATDGANVYWTNRTGDVMKIATSGGAPERIAVVTDPTAIAVSGGDVLVAARDGVWKNAVLAAPASDAAAIAAHGERVFWTTNATAGPVMTCALADCVVARLAGGDASFAIATDDANVYWSDWNAIWTCPLEGCSGAPKPLAAVSGHVAIAVDDAKVYWAYADEGVVLSCDKHSCTEPSIVATKQTGATALASDGTHLYWLTSSTVMRDDGELTALDAPGVALALDDQNVYVAAGDRVVKISKN